ncbi:hypothetical protein PENVUL_c001G03588 [Penicillium vulpinum]|uniref:Uncharacterized protein n=1 Tax=Penicillium vulpinum TaxID=29845 RepID=A0A1V6SFG5_9EURO|nr:hypothetical protein PENVUL_c001G03588 [Penicillium vulpinum]
MAFYEVLLSSQNILGLEIPRIIAGLSFLLAAILAVRLVRRIYRVCWNPLKNFKGLPEAAVSEDWLYRTTEFGTAEQVFEALHRKYNTKALRIGLKELHITDIELYKVIYSQTKAYPKYSPFYDGFNTPHSRWKYGT